MALYNKLPFNSTSYRITGLSIAWVLSAKAVVLFNLRACILWAEDIISATAAHFPRCMPILETLCLFIDRVLFNECFIGIGNVVCPNRFVCALVEVTDAIRTVVIVNVDINNI